MQENQNRYDRRVSAKEIDRVRTQVASAKRRRDNDAYADRVRDLGNARFTARTLRHATGE